MPLVEVLCGQSHAQVRLSLAFVSQGYFATRVKAKHLARPSTPRGPVDGLPPIA